MTVLTVLIHWAFVIASAEFITAYFSNCISKGNQSPAFCSLVWAVYSGVFFFWQTCKIWNYLEAVTKKHLWKERLKIPNSVVILFRLPLAANACHTVTIIFLMGKKVRPTPILPSGVWSPALALLLLPPWHKKGHTWRLEGHSLVSIGAPFQKPSWKTRVCEWLVVLFTVFLWWQTHPVCKGFCTLWLLRKNRIVLQLTTEEEKDPATVKGFRS